MGIFSPPSALQAKVTVILNLSLFLLLICFIAKPQSGGALYSANQKLFQDVCFSKLTVQIDQIHQDSSDLLEQIWTKYLTFLSVLLRQLQDLQIQLHHAFGVL
jgi:hypothetical protein